MLSGIDPHFTSRAYVRMLEELHSLTTLRKPSKIQLHSALKNCVTAVGSKDTKFKIHKSLGMNPVSLF